MRRFSIIAAMMLLFVSIMTSGSEPAEGMGITRSEGEDLYVSPAGSTWSVIQRAIENATEGDTIHIAPGDYSRGFLLIRDGLTISGNHTQGDVNISYPGSEVVIGVSSDNSTISGLNVVEDGGHVYCMMIGQSKNTSLDNMTFGSTLSHVLSITNCDQISMTDMEFSTGERRAMEVQGTDDMKMSGFSISSPDSQDCITFSGDCYGIEMEDGSISMDEEDSIPISSEDGLELRLDTMDVHYGSEFIRMEKGDVVAYDTFFDFGDVNITSGSLNDTFRSYVRKEITAVVEMRNGTMVPAEGVELNLSDHEGSGHRTPYFGGTSMVSDEEGSFGGTFNLLNFNTTGGDFGYTEGYATLEAYYPHADMNDYYSVEEIDLTDDQPVTLEFTDVWYVNGSVLGEAIYQDGPLSMTPVVNATVEIMVFERSKMTRINGSVPSVIEFSDTTMTNSTGGFTFLAVPFGHDLIISLAPPNNVEPGGNRSGYTSNSKTFHHHMVNVTPENTSDLLFEYDDREPYPHTRVDLVSNHYRYEAPSEGPIRGTVRFGVKGPLANRIAPNTTVYLYNSSGELVMETLSDEEGNYSFSNVSFGEDYELRAMPEENIRGVTNEITGYLFWDGSAFAHTEETVVNISLKYYDHIPPTEKHPKVAIMDSDNRPLAGVKVTIYTSEGDHSAYTNDDGIATFDELEGIEPPAGSSFRAELDGYETVEWDHGDGIPKMEKEPEREDDLILVWILIGMIVLVLSVGAYLMTRKKKMQAPEE